ncbi:Ribosomal protein L20 family protein [Brugia pahangi]
MRSSGVSFLRRVINSPYHPFYVKVKPDVWQKREQLRRFVAWQYGFQRTTVRRGLRKLNKLYTYLNMQREDAPKLEKFYAEERIKAALAEYHFEYAPFRNMLAKAHVLLDNVVISQLAVYEPESFKSLVMLTKQMAVEDGRAVVTDEEQMNVHTDQSLFGTPFEHSKVFPRGAAENHQKPPRPLKITEY